MKKELEAEIVRLRQSGKSMNLIAEELGVKVESVHYFCKKNGLGGRRATEQKQRQQIYRNQYANEDPTDRINKQLPDGLEFAGTIQRGDNGTADIRCKACGTVTRRSLSAIRHSYLKPLRCPACDERERKAKAEEKAERIRKRAEKRTETKELRAIETSKQIVFRRCPACGDMFIGSGKYCGQKCQRRAATSRKEAMRRARLVAQCIDTDITIEGLIARDGRKCYLCGVNTDFNDCYIDEGGSFHVGDSYPTIEHVVPLSKGGNHSWANTKVACWRCNTRKGTRLA